MESSKPQRKACDLCYRKKLKCDGQTPRCSTCVSYEVECTHKAASRKKGAAKQTAARREAEKQATVRELEERLQAALSEINRLEKKSNSADDARRLEAVRNSGKSLPIASTSRRVDQNLPSAPEAFALVEEYLATFNTVFPLFDPETVLRTLRLWYSSPSHDDPITYGLLNVVLALAHHTSLSKPPGNAAIYLHNAQSVLSHVISSDSIDLVNVQIPLGLALLFWFVNDLGPAIILVATALRLAHQIGLQRKAASVHLGARERTQRERVFWMAYVLDRDTSMLARVAPIQQDCEIDLDLPPKELRNDFAGFVFTPDGLTAMNFFRARVQLARIQGRIYEHVYSLSAQNATPEERSRNIASVLQALDDWSAQIPPEFRAMVLTYGGCAGVSRYFCILYGVRLGCRALISHASSRDSFHYSKWVEDVQDYVNSNTAEQVLTRAPISKGWQALLEESRAYMALFEMAASGDPFITSLTSCAYFTGLVCLSANNIFDTRPDFMLSDKRSMDRATALLEEMAAGTGAYDKIRQLRDAVRELKSCAIKISCRRYQTTGADFLDGEPLMTPSPLGGWQFVEGGIDVSELEVFR